MNSKRKGNRGELELVHILEKRFGKGKFKRTPLSGAHVGGLNQENARNLPFEAKITLVSDIITPRDFRFIIEHKFYDKIDFWELFSKKSNWNKWIEQIEYDARFVNKEVLIVIKYNRHKRICLVDLRVLNDYDLNWESPDFTWNGYRVVYLEDLLKLPDDWWFER